MEFTKTKNNKKWLDNMGSAQNQILVCDTNMDFEMIFNLGITSSNVVFEHFYEEYNDTMCENLLFTNINHDYKYLSIQR